MKEELAETPAAHGEASRRAAARAERVWCRSSGGPGNPESVHGAHASFSLAGEDSKATDEGSRRKPPQSAGRCRKEPKTVSPMAADRQRSLSPEGRAPRAETGHHSRARPKHRSNGAAGSGACGGEIAATLVRGAAIDHRSRRHLRSHPRRGDPRPLGASGAAGELKDENARSVVGQVAGIVSLLLALVLGTLIGTSFGFFSAQKTELETLSSQILMLDQALTQYGPETKPARDRLKESVEQSYNTFWGDCRARPKAAVGHASARVRPGDQGLYRLPEARDRRAEAAVASANVLAGQIMQGRHPDGPAGREPPGQFGGMLVVMTIWAVVLFFAMGLFIKTQRTGARRDDVRRALRRVRDLPDPRAGAALHRRVPCQRRRAAHGSRHDRQVALAAESAPSFAAGRRRRGD